MGLHNLVSFPLHTVQVLSSTKQAVGNIFIPDNEVANYKISMPP